MRPIYFPVTTHSYAENASLKAAPCCPGEDCSAFCYEMKAFESTSKRSVGTAPKWPSDPRRARAAFGPSVSEHGDNPRWMLVQRIVSNNSFRRSTLLTNFLLFVCDRHLAGRSSEINEKQIGLHVFGRMEGYNASDDNIVRNYARMLRKRLEEYFATEGQHEELTLRIPRGGYVPVFLSREVDPDIAELPLNPVLHDTEAATNGSPAKTIAETTVSPANMVEDQIAACLPHTDFRVSQKSDGSITQENGPQASVPAQEERRDGRTSRWRFRTLFVLAACTIALSALAGYIGAHGLPRGWFQHVSPGASVNRLFWSRIFEEHRSTYIVPTDGGLVMLQSFTREHVFLEDYASGSYRKDSAIEHGITGLTGSGNVDNAQRLALKVQSLVNRRYTSMADLELTTRLARLPEVVPERLMIRYARDLRIDDLRNDNVILIGSIEGNPWVDLFQRQLNFRFTHGAEFGGSGIITNQHPLPGERQTYTSEPNDPLLRTYGVIAYVPNLDGTGHALLIEGVNMAGTQAAGELLLDPARMQPVLDHARGANGVIRPFEILIATDNIAANASQPRVLSERVEQ